VYLVAGHPGPAVAAGTRARALVTADGGELDFLTECMLGEALAVAGQAPEGVRRLERVLALIEDDAALADDPKRLVLAACSAQWLERPSYGLGLAVRAVGLARERCAYSVLPYALEVSAWLAGSCGRWDAAVAYASEALERARYGGELTVVVHSLNHLALFGAARGEEAATRAYVDEARALAVEQGLMAEWAEHSLARLDLAAGRLEEAAERLGAVERSLDERGGRWNFSSDYVEALFRLGRIEEARTAYARHAQPEAAPANHRAAAVAARCRALLAEGDEWEPSFVEALELHRLCEDVWAEAHTQLCFGERLRRAARRLDAREQLRAALATFERLRAEPWAERARAELRATGETVRRRGPWEEVELTPQELQIALQVARGLSNREVGAALYLSHKTVEFHLSRIYRKLNFRSRAELVRRFAADTAA
jgi:DNA-binding CsgD family transcriptional regulator